MLRGDMWQGLVSLRPKTCYLVYAYRNTYHDTVSFFPISSTPAMPRNMHRSKHSDLPPKPSYTPFILPSLR